MWRTACGRKAKAMAASQTISTAEQEVRTLHLTATKKSSYKSRGEEKSSAFPMLDAHAIKKTYRGPHTT